MSNIKFKASKSTNFDYNNNQYAQQFNAENNVQHIQNYREEDGNESENEEGDGYFKRLLW